MAAGAAGVAAATMTDRSEAPTAKLPPRPRIRKPGPLGVIVASFGLFFAITALLAFQMRRGADPALGAPKQQLAAPHQILVRRVIVEHRTGRARSTPPRSTAAPAPAPLTTRSS
jgi:hypothetical protein